MEKAMAFESPMVVKEARTVLFKLRMLYLFMGLAGGLFNPYLTTLLVHQGMPANEVGVMMSAGALLSIVVQPIWGIMVDRFRQTKLVLLLGIAVPSSLAYFYNVKLYIVFIMVYTLSIIFQVTQSPISDSYAVSAAQAARTSYGTIRSLGSLGTALGGYAGGLYLSNFGITQLWMPFLLFSLAASLTVMTISNRSDEYRSVISLSEGFRKMIHNRSFLIFLIACFFVNQTLTAYNSFFVLSFQQAGGSYSLVGVALLIASLTNVPSMLLAAKVLRSIGREKTLVLAAFAYALRWAIQWLFPIPSVMVSVQVLHGLSFGLFYVAAVEYVALVSGKEMRATGQSVFNMVFSGLGGIVGNLLNGYLFYAGGPGAMYLACTVSALMGAAMLYWINRLAKVTT